MTGASPSFFPGQNLGFQICSSSSPDAAQRNPGAATKITSVACSVRNQRPPDSISLHPGYARSSSSSSLSFLTEDLGTPELGLIVPQELQYIVHIRRGLAVVAKQPLAAPLAVETSVGLINAWREGLAAGAAGEDEGITTDEGREVFGLPDILLVLFRAGSPPAHCGPRWGCAAAGWRWSYAQPRSCPSG